MKHDANIRPGIRSDIPAVMRLVRELAEYERAADEVSNSEEQMLRDGFGEHPAFGFYVAEVEGMVVGIALFYTRYSTWKGRCLYLEDIVVTDKFRALGIGRSLFLRCVQHASDHHFAAINWQVLDWNAPAINFYDKFKAEKDGEWINCRISNNRFAEILHTG